MECFKKPETQKQETRMVITRGKGEIFAKSTNLQLKMSTF